MIQVTLDLENEHVLADNLKGLLGSLSKEQIQEIASKALFKYLTDIVDYDKKKYVEKSIAEARKKGVQGRNSWNSKSTDELAKMTDDQIRRCEPFRDKYMKDYKSPKETRLDQINEIIDAEVKKKASEFVSTNSELQTLVTDKQEKVAADFENIVKESITGILSTLVFSTIQNAQFGANTFNQFEQIKEILERNNIY